MVSSSPWIGPGSSFSALHEISMGVMDYVVIAIGHQSRLDYDCWLSCFYLRSVLSSLLPILVWNNDICGIFSALLRTNDAVRLFVQEVEKVGFFAI